MPTPKKTKRPNDVTTAEAVRRSAVVDMARDLYRAEMASPGKWLARSSAERRTLAQRCLVAADDFLSVVEA